MRSYCDLGHVYARTHQARNFPAHRFLLCPPNGQSHANGNHFINLGLLGSGHDVACPQREPHGIELFNPFQCQIGRPSRFILQKLDFHFRDILAFADEFYGSDSCSVSRFCEVLTPSRR